MNNHPLFLVFDESLQQKLMQQTRTVIIKKHQMLFLEGQEADMIYFISTGLLKCLKTSSNGHETIFAIYGSQQFLALSVLFTSNPSYPVTAVALQETKLLGLPRPLLEAAILSSNTATRAWFQTLNRRLETIQQLLTDQRFLDANQRFKKVMRQFIKWNDIPQTTERTIKVYVPLSRQELAQYLGIRRETLSRMLATFQKEGHCIIKNQTFELSREWLVQALD